MYENRILRRIFGPKSDENSKWLRLHNEEIHSLYRSSNIVRVIKSKSLTGPVARMEEVRNAFIILTHKLTVRINLPLFSTVLSSNSCCFCHVGLSLL